MMETPTSASTAYVNHRLKFELILRLPLIGMDPS